LEVLSWALAFACTFSVGSSVEAREARLRVVGPSELRVEWGQVQPLPGGAFALRSAGTRAVIGDQPRAEIELTFTYRGPTRDVAPLASGELRRQIGLKLRARDTCNVVYVMWHIAPTSGIHVSVKSNPSMSEHAGCRDHGYLNLRPRGEHTVAAIARGERHVLLARIEGTQLRVKADGAIAWEGELPPDAFAFDGPAGIRSDNGEFDVQLRITASQSERR